MKECGPFSFFLSCAVRRGARKICECKVCSAAAPTHKPSSQHLCAGGKVGWWVV